MQTTHHFRLELRHATVPTYVASYLFPLLLVLYEVLQLAMMPEGKRVIQLRFSSTVLKRGSAGLVWV